MPSFCEASLKHLATCRPELQKVAHAAIELVDFGISCGHRPQDEQHRAFIDGTSRLDWPDSRHNPLPSAAFDFYPVPLDWNDRASFVRVARVILTVAKQLGIEISWGGDWKKFVDLPHVELKNR